MLESVNLPSSLLTVPVTKVVSVSVFKITFTKGKTVLAVLSFTVPEMATVLFCANEFDIEHSIIMNDAIAILYFIILIKQHAFGVLLFGLLFFYFCTTFDFATTINSSANDR